jgi:hypothetical protein
MADARPGPPIGTAILVVLAIVLYAGMMGSLSGAAATDAAGRGMALAFGAILATLLMIVLAIQLLVAAIKGEMSLVGKIGSFILLPVALVAMWIAGDAYGRHDYSAIWVPALLPPFLLAYALRARFAPLRLMVHEGVANATLAVAVLILAGVPLVRLAMPAPRDLAAEARAAAEEKQRVENQQQAEQDRKMREEAEFAALGPDTHIKDYLVYLQSAERHDRALAGIRRARNRQADAIEQLQLGHIRELPELWRFNLEPTPALCEAYGSALASAAGAITKARSDYLALAIDLEWQLDNMQWFVKEHCDLKQPLGLLEANVRAVADSERMARFADELAKLRRAN